jgi:hypothetical protein
MQRGASFDPDLERRVGVAIGEPVDSRVMSAAEPCAPWGGCMSKLLRGELGWVRWFLTTPPRGRV